LFFSMSAVPVVIFLDFLATLLHLGNPVLRVVLMTLPMTIPNMVISIWLVNSCSSLVLLISSIFFIQVFTLVTTKLYLEVVTKYVDGHILM
jgi:hypothetical protein